MPFPHEYRDALLKVARAANVALNRPRPFGGVSDTRMIACHELAKRIDSMSEDELFQHIDALESPAVLVIAQAARDVLVGRSDLPRCLTVELAGDFPAFGRIIGSAVLAVEHYERERRRKAGDRRHSGRRIAA